MDDDKKTGPRDVFTHLLAIIFLYVTVLTFGSLIFILVDRFFPDPLVSWSSGDISSQLRWPLAVLTIIFPLYLWLTYYLQKDILRIPEKRELKTRKWLLYFTLFLTTIAIVVDLVTLLYNFLNGELTLNFILKVLAVFAIAASVFAYYLWTLRKDIPACRHPRMRVFVFLEILLVSAFIIFGFYVNGLPQSERLRRFDARRESDLAIIQNEIVVYWQAKRSLPAKLDDLRNDITGFAPPSDPITGSAYEYRVTGTLSFELCATFETSSGDQDLDKSRMPAAPFMGGLYDGNWRHDAGRVCFMRTIDPDLYPPLKKIQ